MQVKLEKQYPIAANADAAWHVLRDIRQLAACMPGAEITEQNDATHYKGNVRVKVGPASAAFGGEIEILDFDEANRSIHFKGKGADKGGSSASMDLAASVRPGDHPGQCLLLGTSEVTVNGKFAQFGGRMMTSVSDMILQQFAANFAIKAAAVSAPATAAAPATAQAAATAAPAASAPKMHTELNAGALLWGLIKNFFAHLFGVRKS